MNLTLAAGDPGAMLSPRAKAALSPAGSAAPPNPGPASAGAESAPPSRGAASTGAESASATAAGSADPAAEKAAVTGRGRALAAASIAGVVVIAVSVVLVGHHGEQPRTRLAAPQGDPVLAPRISPPPGGRPTNSPSPWPGSPSASPTQTAKADATADQPSASKAAAEAAGQGVAPDSSGQRTSAPTTAAAAVVRLAAAHPGRHICYRAYVTGVGWEGPVCDGGVAGGTGNNGPIQAVELSTAGTSGNEANAYMAKGGWQGGGWKGAGNGRNLVIGNPGSGTGMKAFMTRVKSGTICANTYVSSNVGWQITQCGSSGAKPDYLFCGLADSTPRQIEAVVFKV
ncbi:hypothetical protein [Streptomyces sp. NPDC006739]|uniref:hypothetical protein n=1 Tax=Streptomyces sp. NPDC006739 TaxID=3364763 RepID=UPI00369857B5